MKILSIDWDYFFPDSSPYDWSSNEENGLFYEIIWSMRITNKNMFTRESVLDEYVPTIPEDFWGIVKNRPQCYKAESHKRIWDIIDIHRNVELTNIDAHHDCGYKHNYDYRKLVPFKTTVPEKVINHIDCGNWGAFGQAGKRITKFKLVYPAWRKKYRECDPNHKSYWFPKNVKYKLPKPANYDIVFICRSACWTPPWFDKSLFDFIDSSNMEFTPMDDYINKMRGSQDIEELKKQRDIQLEQYKELEKRCQT